MSADFLSRHFCDLCFQTALFAITELAGAGDVRFGESQAQVEFLLQLLGDSLEKWNPAMINQHRNQITNMLLDSLAVNDRIQELAFLIRRNGRIYPHPP